MMYALTTGGGGQRPGKDPAILPDLAQVRKTHTLLSLLFKGGAYQDNMKQQNLATHR